MSTLDERNALRTSLEARGVRVVLDFTALADEPYDGTVLLLSPDDFTPEMSDAPTRQPRPRARSFTKRGLERALRAAQAVGISTRIEVVCDKITIITDNKPMTEVANGHDTNEGEWDNI